MTAGSPLEMAFQVSQRLMVLETGHDSWLLEMALVLSQ